MRKHVVVGTAGHIDHGKTSLVEALTGVNTDRWEEERRRGITIDLGFAWLDLADDLRLELVDVPGHERFVKNMLAGAGGIDLALLTVAADESIMPQTREHFDICRLLGVRSGVVALTKSDLADRDLLELVRLEVEEMTASSFLEDAPVVAVSARTGAGLGELRQALETVARRVRAKDADRRFRLPIDRVFSLKGFGTIVTGTLTNGAVEIEQEVEILPLGRKARVRGLESHGKKTRRAAAGRRTALNLAGVDAGEVHRGLVACEAGAFRPSDRIDVRLELLPLAKPLRHGAAVRFHAGAAEIEARALLLERDAEGRRLERLEPGGAGFAQLRLREPAVTLPGDRFVIRRLSPVVTVGGGTALDNQAPLREKWERRRARLEALSKGDPAAILEALIEAASFGVGAADLVPRTGWQDAELADVAAELAKQRRAAIVRQTPLWIIHQRALELARQRLRQTLGGFHRKEPLAPGAPRASLASGPLGGAPLFLLDFVLASTPDLVAEEDRVRLASHRVKLAADEQQARQRLLDAVSRAGLASPSLKELLAGLDIDAARARQLLAALFREGRVVRVTDDLILDAAAYQGLLQRLQDRKRLSPRISVPEFKDLARVSRKHAIPLLEHLDRQRLTRREGDERVIL